MRKIIAKSDMAKEIVKDYFQARKAFREIWKACEKGKRYTEAVPKWLVVRIHKNYEAAQDVLFDILEEHTGREIIHIDKDGIIHFIDMGDTAQLMW